jgi:hypothetical protein
MAGFNFATPTGVISPIKVSSKMNSSMNVSELMVPLVNQTLGGLPHKGLISAQITGLNSSGAVKMSLLKGNKVIYSVDKYSSDAWTEVRTDWEGNIITVEHPAIMDATFKLYWDAGAPSEGQWDETYQLYRLGGGESGPTNYTIKMEVSGDITSASYSASSALVVINQPGSTGMSSEGGNRYRVVYGTINGVGRAVVEIPFTVVP